MSNKTKIVATIGPASNQEDVLTQLIQAGMNVARLNFSHGTYDEHKVVYKRIRAISHKLRMPVAILLDLQGPKIRTGLLKDGEPVTLENGKTFSITKKDVEGSAQIVSTTYKDLPSDVKIGDTILIDDGLIELNVLSSDDDTVNCKVINGGVLKEHKGINLPGVNVSAPSLTEKDIEDLHFGIKLGVDYFALSFVRSASDLEMIKSLMKESGADIPVIAKIEKPEAVDNLDEILEITDAVMVARGDLGVEMHPEQVPTIQKMIIHKAIKANVPVITATQMLETMSTNPIPTRAEASDVANAIFDGTDAVMLSGETASGKFPVKAVEMMTRIATEAESSPFMRYNLQFEKDLHDVIHHAIAQSSVNILHEVDAKAIVSFSISGKTSKLISKQRPSKPVYVFTASQQVYDRLSLLWGITPLMIFHLDEFEEIIKSNEHIICMNEIVPLAEEALKDKGLIKTDDLVIIVTGLVRVGTANLIKIHRIGRDD